MLMFIKHFLTCQAKKKVDFIIVYSVTSSKLGVKLPLFRVYCENNKLLKHLYNKICNS